MVTFGLKIVGNVGSLKRVKVRPPSEFVAKGAHTTQKGPSGGLHKMNHCSLKNLGYLKKVGQILLPRFLDQVCSNITQKT